MLALALSLARLPPEPSPGASLSQEIKICVPGGPKTRAALRSDASANVRRLTERRLYKEFAGAAVAGGTSLGYVNQN